MSGAVGNITVLVGDHLACFKIAGRANFNGSAEFKSLLQALHDRDTRRYILDLRECVLMDSTFVGILAKFSQHLAGESPAGSPPRIELLGAGTRVDDMLDNLGVNPLFGRLLNPAEIPSGLTPLDVNPGPAPSARDRTQTCLEAHETLMALNPENVKKFDNVHKCLVEDLKKLPADPTT